MTFAFTFFAVVSVAGAVCAMTLRNVVHCVLAAILFFFGIAGLFVTLHAEFIAAIQVLVYVGAVGVLLALAILLTRHITGTEGPKESAKKWSRGVLTGGAVFFALAAAIWIEKPWLANKSAASTGTVKQLGEAMMERFVLPLEVVAVLLTAAMVGAIVIAMEEITNRKAETRSTKPEGISDNKSQK
jgi:NADH-quinone oxidoreductase subunit J